MDEDQIQPERRPVLLFAFANDERPGRRLGGLCREVEEIRRTLIQAERDGSCEIVVRESTTPAELVEVLEDPRYRRRLTAIHFAGHASGSRLLLEGEGEPIAARIQGLAPLLGELESLALVFLNGCGTLAQGERLVWAGIPAVIATEHSVEDEQAQRFAVDVYRNLAGGASISEAFARALAQAQCFVPVRGIVRDLVLAPEDEEPLTVWRLLLADPHGDAKDWSLSTAVDDPLFGLPAPVGGVLPQEPFMGLRRFTVRESAVLFGRGRAIRNLYRDVTDPTIPSLVVVYGASGVGKSSLLEAGLLPRVAAGHEVHDFRLERGQDPESMLRHVLADADGRVDLAAAWRARERAGGRPVVICIDQLEVLLLGEDGTRALARFVRALKPLGGPERPQGKLLLGLRKEWFAELRNELKRHHVEWHDHFVEPLGRDDIEEVVLGPTRTASLRARYGITYEDGLARRIADDLSQDRRSAIAPMLQILLTRMWERTEPQLTSVDGRVRRRFTLETYDELRRDGLALSDFVDRQLEALRAAHAEALASGLVLELLFRHTTPRGTAASSSYDELRESYAHRWEAVERLVERCVSLYLLQVVSDVQGVGTGVRLAHDTLAPIVRDRYLRSKAPAQAAARLLEARMGMSEASGRSRLLDEHDLEQVEAAQAGMRRWTEEEERLVDESRRRRKWAVWMRRGRVAVIVVSLAVAVGALVIRELESASEVVVEEPETRLGPVDVAASEAPVEPALGNEATAEHALEEDAGREAEPTPRRSSGNGLVREEERPASLDDVRMAADSSARPDRLTTAKPDRTRPSDCAQRTLPTGSDTKIESMEVTADGEQVALGMAALQQAFVFEPLLMASASLKKLTTRDTVNHLVWDPDGRRLAIGQNKGKVQIVPSEREGDSVGVECVGHASSIKALAFAKDGKTLMTADALGEVILWKGDTCEALAHASLGAEAYDLRPRSHGSWLVAGAGGRLLAWTAADSKTSSPTPVSKGDDAIWRLEPFPTGTWVLAVGQRLRMWNPRTDKTPFDEKLSHTAYWVFTLDDGELVLTASERTIDLWQRHGNELKTTDSVAIRDIEDVAVSRDGRDVLIADATGSVRWVQRSGTELEEGRSLAISSERLSTIVADPSLRYFAVGDHVGKVTLVTLPLAREKARICSPNDVP